jgi:hypothetical protein
MRSAVAVAPSAVKVGKHLIKGGGSAALAFAMVELADGAIDWVLDPANNRVIVKEPISGGGSVGQYEFTTGVGGSFYYPSPDAACDAARVFFIGQYGAYFIGTAVVNGNKCDIQFGGTPADRWINSYDITKRTNPAYDPNAPTTEEKYIPIDTVAAKVISNAEAGHADSQEAVKATALEGFAAGEHDAALEAAAVPDTGVENPPDTENPPKDPEAPAEPFDPSSIIAAINSLKAMLAGILSSMTGFFDWAQAPVPPDDQEKKDVPFATTGDVGLDEVDRFEQRIDFSGQCPVNDFSFTMMGVTYAKPIPYYHLCGFLEQIAPWLLAMCYLGTAYFVVENI